MRPSSRPTPPSFAAGRAGSHFATWLRDYGVTHTSLSRYFATEEGAGRLPRVPILMLLDREADVFDLTIERHRNHFASGVLVHNY